MADQPIRESVSKVREFIQLWLKFNQMYKEAMKNSSITPEAEEAFLETKSIMARKFQALSESMPIDRPSVDRIYGIINQILSLKSISAMQEETMRKIENEWHESYISLNRLLGRLEAQQESAVRSVASGTGKAFKGFFGYITYIVVLFIFALLILYFMKILGVLK